MLINERLTDERLEYLAEQFLNLEHNKDWSFKDFLLYFMICIERKEFVKQLKKFNKEVANGLK